MTIPAEPRRRRPREDKAEQPLTFLPVGNPPARFAYLCAIIGLIPVVGLLLGLPALCVGIPGWRRASRDPDHRGLAHSRAAVLLGAMELVFNGVGLWLIGTGLEWF